MPLVGRHKCLILQNFLKKLTGETVIKNPTKAAHRYKFSSTENGLLGARMMPARTRSITVKTTVRSGISRSGGWWRQCCRPLSAGG